MIAEKALEVEVHNPYLKLVSESVREMIRIDEPILREVTSDDEIRGLIERREDSYNHRKVSKPCNNKDPFDKEARFFVLEDDKGYASKSCRVINRNSLGILPTELNLKNKQELIDFFTRYGHDVNHEVLEESTLDSTSRDSLSNLIKRCNRSQRVYEVGGLFGKDDDVSKSLELILGIGQIGSREKWDLVIQTNHARHSGVYMTYPYRSLSTYSKDLRSNREGFLDYCQRHGQIITLEGEEFRKEYEKIQIDCVNLSEPESGPY